jgi:hypothetical protein
MMRKLLILFLVLGVASTANALLIEVDDLEGESFDVDELTTITVVSEDTSSWLGYIIIEEGGAGTLENLAILDAAGDSASTGAYTEVGWGTGFELTAAATNNNPPIAVGTQFSLDYVGEVGDTATISLFVDPEYTTPIASVNVTVVPEPMTVILLGLGGLFLRRRR